MWNGGQLEIYVQKWDEPVTICATATFLHNTENMAHFRIAIVKKVYVVELWASNLAI